jgi:putative hydrolase of HD superfamily
MSDLHARLPFFLATDALKDVQRANWIRGEARFETVAEHCWHATLLAMLFADAAPGGIDHNRVRDLLIIHDLVEVYAGDTPIFDVALRESEAEREMAAGERLIALLPSDVLPWFDPLLREFHDQATEEARFARAIDTLHPSLLSWTVGGHRQSSGAITPSSLLERKHPTIAAYPVIWELVVDVVQGAVNGGLLPADDVVRRVERLASAYLTDRLEFFFATDVLKEVQRANRVHASMRFETVAEHCWHASLLALLFADAAPDGIDQDRVRDLLTIHDLVEVYAGDTPLWDIALRESEAEREMAAGERLMALLSSDVSPPFDSLFREFQDQNTAEARFARAIDSLHPLLVSWTEGGQGHPEHAFTPSWLVERKRSTLSAYPELWELALAVFQGAVDRGMLPPDDLIQRTE